jgi:hypothetical protein
MTRLAAEARIAVSVGMVGGAFFGCVEGLLTLRANAFVQAGQYLFVYLTVPVLAWMAVGVGLLLPLALIRVLGRSPGEPQHSIRWYFGVLAVAGVLSLGLSWAQGIETELRSVGLSPGLPSQLVLFLMVVLPALAAGTVAGAAAAWGGARIQRLLSLASRAAAATALLLVLPGAHFVATDWKWSASHSVQPEMAPGRPNVLLISIDTLRADHVGASGERPSLTPALDAVGREGVVFEQAITSSPWTLPAIASLLTGLYPHRHAAGIITNHRDPLAHVPHFGDR